MHRWRGVVRAIVNSTREISRGSVEWHIRGTNESVVGRKKDFRERTGAIEAIADYRGD